MEVVAADLVWYTHGGGNGGSGVVHMEVVAADLVWYALEVSIGIQNFGIPIPTDNRHRNSVGHQQIYRTDFGTTPKDLTSRAINLHYYFRVVLKTLSCSVYLALKC